MFVTGTPLTRDAVAVVRPVRVTPEKALKPRIITKYWPAAGAVIVHVSLLPLRNGRQSNRLVVGCAPRLTYRSASPDPPLIVKTTLSFPAGTSMTQNCWDAAAPEMLDTGTPSVST